MSNLFPRKARLSVESLEDRTTPTFLGRPGTNAINVNGVTQPTGGLSIAVGDVVQDAATANNPYFNANVGAQAEYVTGSGPGTPSLVQIYNSSGTLVGQFSPFGNFTGGINVAVGDVAGDYHNEIIVSVASNGPPVVGIFNPNGQAINIFAVNGNVSYMGGLNLAVGNVLDGVGSGGYSGGPIAGNFKQEIIVGTAKDLPAVVVMDASGNIQRSFMAFDPSYRVGVTVAAANIDSTFTAGFTPGLDPNPDTNSYDEIIVGATSLAAAVTVYDVWDGGPPVQRSLFLAYDPRVPGNNGSQGVTIAAGNTDGVPGAEIFVSLVGTSRIRVFNGENGGFQGEVSVYPTGYSRVINMAVGYLKPGGYNPLDNNTWIATFGAFNPGLQDNPYFDIQDLAVVAGDGPFIQTPRYFMGATTLGAASGAGLNGP